MQVTIDPSVDMKTPPKTQVDAMPAGRYFAYAGEIMKLQPPHITDEPIVAQMKRIGIAPGKSIDLAQADPAVKKALEGVPRDAQPALPTADRHVRHANSPRDLRQRETRRLPNASCRAGRQRVEPRRCRRFRRNPGALVTTRVS